MSIKATDLKKCVEKINNELISKAKPKFTNRETTPDNCIQEIDKFGIAGHWTGFKPQYIIDAVNLGFGYENWKFVINDLRNTESGQVIASVDVYVHIIDTNALEPKEEWVTKGTQYGHMRIGKGNEGDACKGAITDAVGKCLSLWSVGNLAYKGLLNAIYESSNNKPVAIAGKNLKTVCKPAKELNKMFKDKKITKQELDEVAIRIIGKVLTPDGSSEEDFQKVLDVFKKEKTPEEKA